MDKYLPKLTAIICSKYSEGSITEEERDRQIAIAILEAAHRNISPYARRLYYELDYIRQHYTVDSASYQDGLGRLVDKMDGYLSGLELAGIITLKQRNFLYSTIF